MKTFPKWMYGLWVILLISMTAQIFMHWDSNTPLVGLNAIGIVVIILLLFSIRKQKGK